MKYFIYITKPTGYIGLVTRSKFRADIWKRQANLLHWPIRIVVKR